jgi:hypothetical protein
MTVSDFANDQGPTTNDDLPKTEDRISLKTDD